MDRPLIGQLLLQAGVTDENGIREALAEQKINHERLGGILTRLGKARERDVIAALSSQFHLAVVDLARLEPDRSLAHLIPAKFAFQHTIFPCGREGETVLIAAGDPLDVHTFDDLRLLLECDVRFMLAPGAEIVAALKKLYGVGAEMIEQMTVAGLHEPEAAAPVPKPEANGESDAAIVRFVDRLIGEAFHDRATDIHLEPFENDLIVRYRIDGILHYAPLPASVRTYQSAIISRIKIMANMDIAEKRLPQDGRIQFAADGEVIDLRVSTLPVMCGESVGLRILPRGQMLRGLEQLGLPQAHRAEIERLIRRPHGIMLVTGPTGHGKTTTLYACLSAINSEDKKIITVEDPVEYQLRGINQIPVHAKVGLTFANGLRAILRHDPDIIMVGEIRDRETAEIAVRASLTGHLVFSTLHTNDAPGAVTRLVDMGIEPYLVTSSLEAVMAQRLVRLVCRKCRREDQPDPASLRRLGFQEMPGDVIYRAGPGCEDCRHTGYTGRTGIYELMVMDEALRRLSVGKASAGALKKEAVRKGMRTLRHNGWDKVRAGVTTIEEIIRVTPEEEGIEL